MAFLQIDISKEYLNYNLRVKNILNSKTILEIPKVKIKSLKKYAKNETIYINYAKNLIHHYDQINYESTVKYLKNLRKIIKKLDVKLTHSESLYLKLIENRILFKNRILKNVSYPFHEIDVANGVKRKCLFSFLDVEILKNSKKKIKYNSPKNIYIFKKEIVIYDLETNRVAEEILIGDINSTELARNYFKLNTKLATFFLRNYDPYLIEIALKRITEKN